ncbi:AAA family ATPase [Sphingomonas lutea]|uniref:non-specific serine/threonine protein kinase n=2 Tax=Sphingomonas lutea TaxID=1045317 RepID=A0A7G9SKY8_9SPHN|nr:ATPase domain-containing protein [Sphingomonas lutea]QNN68513.1 AAA family ATPase [Sphingomonas lutea]
MKPAGIATGSDALDHILAGGYAKGRVHLLEGRPGSGKTTLAMQFLMAARDRGEGALYVSLSEGRDELLDSAATHGWSLEGIDIYELIPPELSLDPSQQQSIIYSSDLELGETVQLVMDHVQRGKPSCVVFDSLSDIRLLAGNSLRYRRQVLALKHFFSGLGCTTIFVDDLTEEMDDANLHSLVHGVIRLETTPVVYGSNRRRLQVFKMRGRPFRDGSHDYIIRTGGVEVFRRLIANEHVEGFVERPPAESGIESLDSLFGGGIDRGTSTLIMGPAGSGKSTLAMQYLIKALERGESALFISFDETRRNFFRRAAGLSMDFAQHGDRFRFLQIDPAELSPGELSSLIRHQVEMEDKSAVVLDSLSGYQNSMPAEQFMLLQMHELLTYLNQQGVITFLILAQHGLVGQMQSQVDLTYLSDSVLLLRFFEAFGELKRALSVVKKRTGGHEASIREYQITPEGVRVGDPLRTFSGVLTGVPTFVGGSGELLNTL